MMFSKAVLTFLAIGALCLNASAAPIPTKDKFAGSGFRSPRDSLSAPKALRPETSPPSNQPNRDSAPPPVPALPPQVQSPSPAPGTPVQREPRVRTDRECGLPRSFSRALSYRDLTFAFSIVRFSGLPPSKEGGFCLSELLR